MKRVEMTSPNPLPVGTWVRLENGDMLRVTACTGPGPFTIAMTPIGRWALAWDRIRHWMPAPRRWWQSTRCWPDRGWCWRRATADGLCDRHWLETIEHGDL